MNSGPGSACDTNPKLAAPRGGEGGGSPLGGRRGPEPIVCAPLPAAGGRGGAGLPSRPPTAGPCPPGPSCRARAGPRRGGGAPVPAGSPEGRQGGEQRRVSAPEPRLPPPRHLAPNFPSQPTWGRGSRRLLPLSAAGRPAAARTTPSPAAAAPSSRLLTPPSGPLPPPSALLRAVCRARPRALTQRRGSGGRAPAPLGACGGERGRGARPALPCRTAPASGCRRGCSGTRGAAAAAAREGESRQPGRRALRGGSEGKECQRLRACRPPSHPPSGRATLACPEALRAPRAPAAGTGRGGEGTGGEVCPAPRSSFRGLWEGRMPVVGSLRQH